MATIEDFDCPPEDEEAFFKYVQWGNRYWQWVLQAKERKISRKKKGVVVDTSWMTEIAAIWSNMLESEKTAWENAGLHCGLTGWELFYQDTVYRMSNDLPGYISPNLNHQFKVGYVEVYAGTEIFLLTQYHLDEYYVYQKNVGQEEAYTPVLIQEVLSGPIKIEFDYTCDMEVDEEEDGGVIVYVNFVGIKDGSPDSEYFYAELNPQTGWIRFSQTFTPTLDTIEAYFIELWFSFAVGIFMFDNVNFEHDSQNWAFDKNCDKISSIQLADWGFVGPAWDIEDNFEKGEAYSKYID